jgi:hypothetical protein
MVMSRLPREAPPLATDAPAQGRAAAHQADLVQLSRRLLLCKGLLPLECLSGFPLAGAAGVRIDVVALDRRNLTIVVAVACRPAERFGRLVALLGSAYAAELVRAGVDVQVHCWARREEGWLCDTLRLGPGDFGRPI